jgi:hypothetical protein
METLRDVTECIWGSKCIRNVSNNTKADRYILAANSLIKALQEDDVI